MNIFSKAITIVQLCLGFGALLWILCYPFMGALYFYKSQMLLHEHVMGKDGVLGTLSKEKQAAMGPKLANNALRFQALFEEEKKPILARYYKLQKLIAEPISTKLKNLSQLPPLELTWIILAITLPILLLLKKEGAKKAAWLLPIVTAFYALDNSANGLTFPSDQTLFPEERALLKEPLASSLTGQRVQLEKAWQTYLIEKWAEEKPSSNPLTFQGQAEKGEFAFNLARLKIKKPLSYSAHFREKQQSGVLALFLAWNLFFACSMQLRDRKKSLPGIPAWPGY